MPLIKRCLSCHQFTLMWKLLPNVGNLWTKNKGQETRHRAQGTRFEIHLQDFAYIVRTYIINS